MTVICEYCESVVELKQNHNCPHCGASLKNAIAQEIERIKAEQAELEMKQELKRKEQEKKEENDRILDFALSLLGTSAGKSILKTVVKEAIKRDL